MLRLALGGVLAVGSAQAMAAAVTLCAQPFTQNLPGPNNTTVAVPMWGYSLGACGAAAPTAPGPVLVVPPGDTTLTVTLQNNLTVPTSLVIAGQKLPDGGAPVRAADVVGPACAADATDVQCRIRSFTSETAPGTSGVYIFTGLKPGSYLYQSGTHQQVQVQMGLFGMVALDGQVPGTSQRQLTANPNTIIDADAPVVLSEIDTAQHTLIRNILGSADLATQQTWQTGKNSTFAYSPNYFLINGKPYDGTTATDLPVTAFSGGFVGLRLANAGLKSRTLVLNNGTWQLLTEDGNDYPAPREQYSVLLPAGKTVDARVIVTAPSTNLAFFDRRGGTDNAATAAASPVAATGAAIGGQVGRLNVSSGGPAPTNLADLAISKTNGVAVVLTGRPTTYTIVASNNGPNAVTGATVTDTVPAALTGVSWTCAASGAGSSCPASGSGNNLSALVNLGVGGTATFSVTGTVAIGSTGTLVNTASIAPPAAITDRLPLNNSATDSDPIQVPTADLSIAKSNNATQVVPGSTVSYTIVASNPSVPGTGAGQSNTLAGATITDTVPTLTGVTWTCSATAGSTCVLPGGGGNTISVPVVLAQGGSATVTVSGTVPIATVGTLSNTASVAIAAGMTDPVTTNNSATDADPLVSPVQTVLDAFDRADALSLGGSWSQIGAGGVGLNNGQALALLGGVALWNAPATGFGAKQGAAFTVASTTFANDTLILKASGAIGALNGQPRNFIRVRYTAPNIVVATTTNGDAVLGGTFTARGTFAATVASGTRISAVANANGSVDVWTTSAAGVLTYVGRSTTTGVPAVFVNAGGRIGFQLPNIGARIDNFGGGDIP